MIEKNQSELDFENKRLEKTVLLAQNQLAQARQKNEENKMDIISAKKELRENTVHSVGNLWSSDNFEALAELSQYANPVTEKIADYEEVEKKIEILENVIKSPYFARIDFKFEDGERFENIYIGRSSLKEDSSYEIYVYDWRSPIASVFYRFVKGSAFYDAPGGRIAGELDLKRQYEINNGILEYFFDADVQIVDEFLRKLLSQNTSTKMKTIVETIQKEQDIVIRDMENDVMMVQGVAGSGKTSIALHRAAYLMYQGLSNKLSANNIIIISPNSLFEEYISNVLPELGEYNVATIVFEEILTAILQRKQIQSKNQFLENLLTNTHCHNVIKESIEVKTSQRFMEILNLFIKDLPIRWIAFEDIYYDGECVVSKERLRDKTVSRADTPLGVKLEQLEDFVIGIINDSRKKHIKKSEEFVVRKEIQKFTELSLIDLYRDFLSDKEYFYSLAKDILLIDEMDHILEYTLENLNSYFLHFEDATVLTYLHLKIYGTDKYKNIKQVVIDEAQDYYPLQYEIFKLLFANSKFTILGDVNQTLEKQEDLSLYEQIGKIINKKKSTLITMDKSFRCTNEILTFSMRFIQQSMEIKSFNRNGDEPGIHVVSDRIAFKELINKEVEYCHAMGYQSIGLLCRTEENALSLFASLQDKIKVQLIRSESASDLQGVFIIPVYMSKGLEFDAVLLCDADAVNYHSEDDKKLLYIACTRALHRLNLFSLGEVSPLL